MRLLDTKPIYIIVAIKCNAFEIIKFEIKLIEFVAIHRIVCFSMPRSAHTYILTITRNIFEFHIHMYVCTFVLVNQMTIFSINFTYSTIYSVIELVATGP